MRYLLFSLVAALFLSSCTDSYRPFDSGSHDRKSNTSSPLDELRYRTGVYSLANPEDVSTAKSDIGVNIIIGEYHGSPGKMSASLKKSRVSIVDSLPQRWLYDTVCANGPASCSAPSDEAIDRLLNRIEMHARKVGGDSSLAGFYLVDDYWADLTPLLKRLAPRLRSAAPEIPLLCGLSSQIEGVESTNSEGAKAAMENSFTNYSQEWCDAIVVYSYSPPRDSRYSSPVDWQMKISLRRFKRELHSRGWDPQQQMLIGAPQAFNYSPRTSVRGKPIDPEFRAFTNEKSLQAQTEAFCRAGAESIVGYAWSDGSLGKVDLLSNSPQLQLGLVRGVASCRAQWFLSPFLR